MKRSPYLFATLFLALSLFLVGCTSDSSDPIGDNHDHDHSDMPLAWVWGYDADSGILTAYHSEGTKRATFAAHIHPMIRIAHAPSETRPTIWMADGHMAQGFTAGFHPHMDHGHMETPEKVVSLSVVHNPAHMSASADGQKVVIANDENQTLTVIDVETGTGDATVTHGSPHSAALMTGQGHLVTTHMQENWAKIVDPLTDTVLAEIPIGSGSHGDAYYAATGRAFIACVEGIEVINTVSMMKTKRLAYPVDGRTSFLYHAGETASAIGLHNFTVDDERQETDSFLLLDMMNETLEAISIPGASLDWSSRDGHFAMAKNGKTVAFADLEASLIYVADIDPDSAAYKSVISISVPAPGVAVGMGDKGEHLFILVNDFVYPVNINEEEVEMAAGFAVKAGTDWIDVTSSSGEVIDESVDKGDALLNPEDAESGAEGDDHDNDHDHEDDHDDEHDHEDEHDHDHE